MIVGIGVDSIEIARIARAIEHNPLLKERLFSVREIGQLPQGAKAYARMAALFAGKEAVLKALGTGLAGHSWQQVEVLHRPGGAPWVCLQGQAKHTAAARGIESIHISLTHDKGRAIGFCIAEGMK